MSDGVQILVAAFTTAERAEALDFVRGLLLEIAKPGPWRELLSALEDDLVAGAKRYDAGVLRRLDPDEPSFGEVRGARWGDGPWSGEAPPEEPAT